MSRILKHKDKFLNSPDKYDHMINLRDPEEMELEDEVYNMYCIKSSQGIKMTHKDLTEVAYAFSKQAKYGGYFIRHKFAFGWIANWKKAYGIEWMRILLEIIQEEILICIIFRTVSFSE